MFVRKPTSYNDTYNVHFTADDNDGDDDNHDNGHDNRSDSDYHSDDDSIGKRNVLYQDNKSNNAKTKTTNG